MEVNGRQRAAEGEATTNAREWAESVGACPPAVEWLSTQPASMTLAEALAACGLDKWRWWVADHPWTPVAVLRELASDVHWLVRALVAENERTPEDVLCVLASDDDERVRRRVAGNPRTPVSVLRTLATDADDGVRHRVAGNPRTPVSVLPDQGVTKQWLITQSNNALFDLQQVADKEYGRNAK